MKILPYDSYEIQTPLNVDKVITLLKLEVEQKKWFRFSHQHKLFEGNVSRDGFKINRIIHYHNAFFPVIRGRFHVTALGTIVKIRMSLLLYSLLFMCFLFGVLIWGILATTVGFIFDKSVFLPGLPFALFILIIGWLLMSYGFWKEVNKVKPLLIKIIQNNKIKS